MLLREMNQRFEAVDRRFEGVFAELREQRLHPTFRTSLCDLSHFGIPLGGPLQSPHHQRRL
jgi:hypothetical protein